MQFRLRVDLILLYVDFFTRASRGLGKGEKLIFYNMLAMMDEDVVVSTLHFIPDFGY